MYRTTKDAVFREWVDDYYDFGFRIANKIMGDEEESRDILQDAFLKVWLKFDTYENKAKFSSWLFTIITNLCIDRLRKKKIIKNHAANLDINAEDKQPGPERLMTDKEIRRVLNELSERLSPKQKIVFVLRDLEEMEMDEVCEITKMSAEVVKANLYYARKAMRESLLCLKLLEEKI
jgi:RNA polymerase sigma-70 factor, ECF subfamily